VKTQYKYNSFDKGQNDNNSNKFPFAAEKLFYNASSLFLAISRMVSLKTILPIQKQLHQNLVI